jgi:lipopolysaccharide transport system ATP-binding protein
LSIALYNEQGICVFTSGSALDPERYEQGLPKGDYRSSCRVPGDLLNDGMYWVSVYISKNGRTIVQHDEVLTFDVRDAVEMRGGWHDKWVGAVRPMLEWTTESAELE